MTMTTQVSHTIRCDVADCMTRGLGSSYETEKRAAVLGVSSAKLLAADAVAAGWKPNAPQLIKADDPGGDPHEITWTCPDCQVETPRIRNENPCDGEAFRYERASAASGTTGGYRLAFSDYNVKWRHLPVRPHP